ncbi:MAG: hypothetical protein GY696_36900, partial [Gammaproteobacteria bacterium]|nr:hypothetical protein [Gammaproteobacteria bacterium]
MDSARAAHLIYTKSQLNDYLSLQHAIEDSFRRLYYLQLPQGQREGVHAVMADSLAALDTLRSIQESSFLLFSAKSKYETVLKFQSLESAPLLTGDHKKAWSLIVKEQEDKAKEEEERKARNNNSYNYNNQSGRFNGTCNWCNKSGHMARDCHQKQRDNNRNNRGNGGGGRGRGGGNNANSPNNSANNTGGA